jgi:hypothetical protein
MIQPVFENIHSMLVTQLEKAKSSIKILMAWFTDEEILQLLIRKAQEGIHIELVLLDHESNKRKSWEPIHQGLEEFEKFKLNLNLLKDQHGSITLIDAKNEFFMHSKFCIIDQQIAITGSYNWTYPAQQNIENIVIIDAPEIAVQFDQEFDRVKSKKHREVLRFVQFPRCPICNEIAARIIIYDYYGQMSEFEENVKEVLFCSAEPVEHIQNLNDKEVWPYELGELIRSAYQDIEDHNEHYGESQISTSQGHERIRGQLATYFGSTNDLFIRHPNNQIFIVMKRTGDPDTEGEFPIFQAIWYNELFEDYANIFIDNSNELDQVLY